MKSSAIVGILGANGVKATKTIPGISSLENGILLFAANPESGSYEPGVKSKIFHLTSNNAEECTFDGYVVPDAFCGGYSSIPSTSTHNGAKYSYKSEDIQVSLAAEMTFAKELSLEGFYINWGTYAFTASEAFKAEASFFGQQAGAIILSISKCTVYKVEMSSNTAERGLIGFNSDFLFDLEKLPLTYDAEYYVNFLLKYGTHYPKSAILGAKVGGLSSFTASSFEKMEGTGIDVDVTAETDTWWRGAESKSGSGSIDENVAIYEAHADGGQTLSTRGSPPSNGDLSQWAKDVTNSPTPIELSLEVLTTLLTSKWFPDDPNIKVKQANVAHAMQDFCDVTKSCFEPPVPPPPPPPSVTGEMVLTGTGHGLISLGPDNSPCFMTRARAFFDGGEVCHIYRQGGNWYLEKSSGQSSFECGARCIQNYHFDGYTTEVINRGSGWGTISLIPEKDGFCPMTYGCSFGDGDGCWSMMGSNGMLVNQRGVTNEHADTFGCGSTCIMFREGYEGSRTDFTITGKGNQEKAMQPVKGNFCFFTYAADWTKDKESCVIIEKNSNNVPYWFLKTTSEQTHFNCGATCISYNATSY